MPESQKKLTRSILSRLGLEFRDRMEVSKLSVGALMRPNFPLKVRLWACILLKACGYNEQLAVTQVAGQIRGERKIVPVSPGVIAGELNKVTLQAFADAGHTLDDDTRKALKLRKQHVSRGLADLEDDGFIDRFVANCQPQKLLGVTMEDALNAGFGRRLTDLPIAARKRTMGRVFIFLLAVPRAPKRLDLEACLEIAGRRMEVTKNDDLSRPNSSDINRYFQESFDFMKDAEFKRRANRAFELAPDRAKGVLEKLANITQAAKDTAMAELAAIADQPAEPAAPAAKQEPLFPKASASLNPNGEEPTGVVKRGDNDTSLPAPGASQPQSGSSSPTRRDADQPLVSGPRSADVHFLVEVMKHYCRPDLAAAAQLLGLCIVNDPRCTVVQIAEAIHSKGEKAKRVPSPVGFLLTAVPRMFEGGQAQRVQPTRAVPRCITCARPVEGETVVNGECGDCVARQYSAAHGD